MISSTPVGQFQLQTVNFTLKPDVTFDSFDVLNLYSVDEQEVYAQAVLKPPPAPTPENTPAATSKPSNATRLSMNQNIMNKIIFSILVALFLFI
jgi:hypothetical protein